VIAGPLDPPSTASRGPRLKNAVSVDRHAPSGPAPAQNSEQRGGVAAGWGSTCSETTEAGECARPARVVKELVENAIDAGATRMHESQARRGSASSERAVCVAKSSGFSNEPWRGRVCAARRTRALHLAAAQPRSRRAGMNDAWLGAESRVRWGGRGPRSSTPRWGGRGLRSSPSRQVRCSATPNLAALRRTRSRRIRAQVGAVRLTDLVLVSCLPAALGGSDSGARRGSFWSRGLLAAVSGVTGFQRRLRRTLFVGVSTR
jgi:hypothetical protein